jgi:hypothetical protein
MLTATPRGRVPEIVTSSGQIHSIRAQTGGQPSWPTARSLDIILTKPPRNGRAIRLPRKYRPPAARRRKSKRPAPYFVEPAHEDGEVAVSSPDETISAVGRVEAPPVAPAPEAPAQTGTRGTPTTTRHISRDYSYVRAEVKRIVLVAGFLIVSLIITALLRG